jgi:hypothetical protein
MKKTQKLGYRSFYFEKIHCKQPVIKHWSWESTLVFTIQNPLKKSSFMKNLIVKTFNLGLE